MSADALDPAALTRDGHLTALSLERHLAGEIDAASHLEACAACAARLDAVQADAAAFDLRPPDRREAGARAVAYWPIVAGVLSVAAALVFLVIRPDPPPDDGVRVKGGFAFEVHAHDGQGSRSLVDGDAVAAGERLGFRVKTDTAGHLLILGRDGAGEVWLAWPQTAQGSSAPIEPSAMRTLDQAVTLDATPGDERLIALLCTTPIHQRDVAPMLARAETPDECRARQITLRKQP